MRRDVYRRAVQFQQGNGHPPEALAPIVIVKLSDKLREIREVRNFSIGHPTKVTRKQEISTHFISRATLTKDGFDLFSFSAHDKMKIRKINISSLIADQKVEIARLVQRVVDELKARDEQHKTQFRDTKFTESFSQVLYAIEKIHEELCRQSTGVLGKWGINELQNSLDRFEQELRRRGMTVETYDAIKYSYEQIRHPLKQLRAYLEGEKSEISSDDTALVFAGFLAGRFKELTTIADEIDDDYAGSTE